MPLKECPPFADVPTELPVEEAKRQLEEARAAAPDFVAPLYLGFAEGSLWSEPVQEVSRSVDAFFTLDGETGFEDRRCLLTFGLRASRFALILFWEALHSLSAGGTWIDIDETERIGRNAIGALDVLDRPYFAHALDRVQSFGGNRLTATVWRKARPCMVAARIEDRGWTFGILTAGPSFQACRMVRQIQALGLPEYEILVCGPAPGPLPDDPNVRRIDLSRPEPRGWITRKKNLIAAEARHENLCLLHDRFRLPGNFAEAAGRLGPAPGITTFPQVFFADASRVLVFRNVDYQITRPTAEAFGEAVRLVNFRLDQFAYPQYNDWRETVHVNGGAYLTRRTLWRAVPQDEALFHGDWEDVVYGIACHRFGVPQRVNPHGVLESVYSHHSLLPFLSLPFMTPDGVVMPRRGFASAAFLATRLLAPQRLKPITRLTEARWREQALAIVPRLPGRIRQAAKAQLEEPLASIGSWWRKFAAVLSQAQPACREDGIALLDLVWRCAASPVWHPNHVQHRLRGIELADGTWDDLLAQHSRYFALWSRLCPSFFESPGGDAGEDARDVGPQARRRALQRLHWKSRACRGVLRAPTSVGERPSPDGFPDRGDAVSWKVAVAARVLLPFERALSVDAVQHAIERIARLDRRHVMRVLMGRVTGKER